jgi:hypothetical protein
MIALLFFQRANYFGGHSFASRIADGSRRVVQPLTIRQPHDQFDGTKKLHCVVIWFAQHLQLARSHKNSDILLSS